jgi:hypothetical protein
MEKLRIDYRNESGGECFMELNCAWFFPCAKKDAKIVFPLAVENCTSETIHELKKHFVDAKELCKEDLEFYSKEYAKSLQKTTDTLEMIAAGRHPSGVRATADELSAARKNLVWLKAQIKESLNEVKRNRRLISKYAENIALLEQYMAKVGV